jgi:hypothetical protein
VGGVFGIALLGTLLTTRLRSTLEPALVAIGLSPEQASTVQQVAGQGELDPSALMGLSAGQRAEVVEAFRQSFMSGFRLSLMVGGLILLAAAIVANRFIPGRAHAHEVRQAARMAGPVEV